MSEPWLLTPEERSAVMAELSPKATYGEGLEAIALAQHRKDVEWLQRQGDNRCLNNCLDVRIIYRSAWERFIREAKGASE